MLKLVALFAMLIGGCLQNMARAQFSPESHGLVSSWQASTPAHDREPAGRLDFQSRLRVPGEFEPHDYLLMACSGDHVHSKTIARIIRETDGSIHPVVLASDAHDRQQLLQDLDEYGVDTDEVTILCVQHDSKWCRDFGPNLVDLLWISRTHSVYSETKLSIDAW